jgi:hypothetical protein
MITLKSSSKRAAASSTELVVHADRDLPPRLKAIQFERGDLDQKLARTDAHIAQGTKAFHTYLYLLIEPSHLFEIADDSARRGILEGFFERIWLDMNMPPQVERRPLIDEATSASAILSDTLRRGCGVGHKQNSGPNMGTAANFTGPGYRRSL